MSKACLDSKNSISTMSQPHGELYWIDTHSYFHMQVLWEDKNETRWTYYQFLKIVNEVLRWLIRLCVCACARVCVWQRGDRSWLIQRERDTETDGESDRSHHTVVVKGVINQQSCLESFSLSKLFWRKLKRCMQSICNVWDIKIIKNINYCWWL